MIAYAEHQAKLGARQEDGSTWGEHLEKLVKMGRKPQSELDGPPLPRELGYLWEWFGELQRTRQMHQHGMQALTYGEIAAWAELTGREPLPHEVTTLLDVDMTIRLALTDA